MTYYHKVLIPYVKQLISDYAKTNKLGEYSLHLSELDEIDTNKFAAILLPYVSLGEVLVDLETDTIEASLARLLNRDNQDNSEDFLTLFKDKIIDFLKPQMQNLINENLCEVYSEMMREDGFRAIQDRENGEITWRHISC